MKKCIVSTVGILRGEEPKIYFAFLHLEEQDCQWRRSVVSLNTDGPEFSLKGKQYIFFRVKQL